MYVWLVSQQLLISVQPRESRQQKCSRASYFLQRHRYVFLVIDEVNAMSAAWLALLHEVMTAIFNPEHRVDKYGDLFPFGGKCILRDPAQLRPVGAATYDEGEAPHTSGKGPSQNIQRNTKGQRLSTRSILYPTASYSIRQSEECQSQRNHCGSDF